MHETPEDWWDLTLAVNLKSIFLVSKYVIAQMLKQDKSETGDRGWIINMSSIFGLVGGYTNGKNPLSTILAMLIVKLRMLRRKVV